MQAFKLCFERLRLGKALKVIENYLKSRPSLIYMICKGIGYNCLRWCKNRAVQSVIYIGDHEVESIDVRLLVALKRWVKSALT